MGHMKKKYEEILETVVRTFLQTHEPIGSAMLKEKLPFDMAPATIRYYFNKMVERGELAQLHKSSGRIPTEQTMKMYWRKHLRELEVICNAMDELARISESEDLFILLKPLKENRLRAIERVGNRYLILVFDADEYVIRYHNQMESFLNDLIGYDLDEVKQIARDVGMISLYHKMRAKNGEEITVINPEAIIRVAGRESAWGKRYMRHFLDGDAVEQMASGLHFDPLLPKGFMALRTEAVIDNRPTKMLCIGAIDQDFTKIFKEA
jgi:heat-inducible transcriptional repressor